MRRNADGLQYNNGSIPTQAQGWQKQDTSQKSRPDAKDPNNYCYFLHRKHMDAVLLNKLDLSNCKQSRFMKWPLQTATSYAAESYHLRMSRGDINGIKFPYCFEVGSVRCSKEN
jgi:hypothetical protein